MAQNKLTYNDRRRTMHFAVFFEMSLNNVSYQFSIRTRSLLIINFLYLERKRVEIGGGQRTKE